MQNINIYVSTFEPPIFCTQLYDFNRFPTNAHLQLNVSQYSVAIAVEEWKKSKILNQLNKFFLHLTNVLGSRPKLQTKVICQTQMVGTKSFTKNYLSCDVFFQYFVNDVYLLTVGGLIDWSI